MLKHFRDIYFWLAAFVLGVNAIRWCILFTREHNPWTLFWLVVLGLTFVATAIIAMKLRDYRKVELRLEELERDAP